MNVRPSGATPWVGAWRWRLDGAAGEVDAAWCEALDLDPCAGPEHQLDWMRNVHPDDLLGCGQRLQELLAGRVGRLEMEFRVLTRQHGWLWILQRGEITRRDAHGAPVEASGICIEIDQRKREENELRESQSQLATALWGARAAFWRWHRPTDTRMPSALWFAMTGYSREQWFAVANPWQERLHPDDRSRVAAQLDRFTQATGTDSLEIEYRIRTATGEWKWILDRARVVEWDPQGPPALIMGVSLDIDAQKAAETRLRETEARLQTAMWGARLGLCETDCVTGATRWFNDWCERVDVDPCVGEDHVASWDQHIHPEDVAEAQRRYAEHIEGRSDYYDAEYRIARRSGGWLWIFERGRVTERDAEGRALRMVGVCIDIDSRRRRTGHRDTASEERLEDTQEALRRSEERFRLAVGAVNGVIYESDLLDGGTRLHGVERLVGWQGPDPPHSLEAWLAMVHAEDRERVRNAILQRRSAARSWNDLHYRVLRPDGQVMHVWHRGSYVRDAAGRAVRAVGLIEDVTAQVQAEYALRRSEHRFRAVARLTPGFVFEGEAGDPPEAGGRLVYLSDGFQPLMGCSPEEFYERGGWAAFCDAPSHERYERALARMRRGESMEVELHGRTPAGREAWLRMQAVPVHDTLSGRRTGSLGVVHDITVAKEAELALRESQIVLQTITASSPTNLSLFDRDHRLVFTNYSLGGEPVEAIVGRRVEEFTEEPWASQIVRSLEAVVSRGEGFDMQASMPVAGQGLRHYGIRLRPVLSGGAVVGVVANISDVTEQRSQQEDLKLQARIIETIREGVVLLDREWRVLLANPAMQALFGHEAAGLAGRGFASLAAASSPAAAAALDRQLRDLERELEAGDAPQFEFEGRRADGGRLVVACILTAIHIGGEPRIVAVLSDVTERKRLERELLQVAQREQQRIGSDLHDGLGQQLTGIALLLKGLVPRLTRGRPAELRPDVEQIVALVNDAIDSTRALARGLSSVPAGDDGLPLALEALATQVSGRHGIEVSVEDALPEGLRLDEATSTHLYRIVQEAFGNALRHGQPRRIVVTLRPDGGQMELAVRDDGTGFDRRAARPAGLGLKIMRYRAQMIGGDLGVESAPGEGTTIRCHCPLPGA